MTRAKPTLLLLAVAAGCYGTPKGTHTGKAGSDGASGGGEAGTIGGTAGGGQSGTTTGDAAGAGSGTVFVGGPCVVTPDQTSVEVFGRANDGHVYRRAFDGRNWESWTQLGALDAMMIDARSDLDCAASIDTIHIVATGVAPPGALMHAFGFGTAYNPFLRELGTTLSAPSPSIASFDASTYYLAWAGRGQEPALYKISSGTTPAGLTPITTQAAEVISGVDISFQSPSILLAGFDSLGMLAIYPLVGSSAGNNWGDPLKLDAPSGAFSFNPAICAERGTSGSFSINVAAVTGHDLWFAGTPRIATGPTQFSSWTAISSDAASSPDCAILRENPSLEAIIHVVTLSSRGTIIDVQGNGTSWATTELGPPH